MSNRVEPQETSSITAPRRSMLFGGLIGIGAHLLNSVPDPAHARRGRKRGNRVNTRSGSNNSNTSNSSNANTGTGGAGGGGGSSCVVINGVPCPPE